MFSPTTFASESTRGPPDEPRPIGAECSRPPAMMRPRGPGSCGRRRRRIRRRGGSHATSGDSEDRCPDAGHGIGPLQRLHVARVDLQDGQVRAGVDREDRALLGAAITETDLCGSVAQVVGVGEHTILRDHHPAATGRSPDGDRGIAGSCRCVCRRGLQLLQDLRHVRVLRRRPRRPLPLVPIVGQLLLDCKSLPTEEQDGVRCDRGRAGDSSDDR